MPYLTSQAPSFAFLTHFRDDQDLYRVAAALFLRRYSRSEATFRRKMCSLPPLVGGEVLLGFSRVRGEIVIIMRLPVGIIGPGGSRALMAGLDVALRRRAPVIGLGALTASATGGGARLLRHLPPGVTLTNGNAYTAAVVRHNVVEAAEVMGLGTRARVAVVGCTGSVGVPASILLAEQGFPLLLVGRTAERARRRVKALDGHAVFAGDLSLVRRSDVVVLLTSDPSALLGPEHVSPGAVVIDFAHPANIPQSRYAEFRRRRATVVEGGIVRIPEFSCSIDFGFPDPGDAAACVAETYLFAKEGIRDHSIGRPAPELALRMERIALRRGIHPTPLALSTRPPAESRQPVLPA